MMHDEVSWFSWRGPVANLLYSSSLAGGRGTRYYNGKGLNPVSLDSSHYESIKTLLCGLGRQNSNRNQIHECTTVWRKNQVESVVPAHWQRRIIPISG